MSTMTMPTVASLAAELDVPVHTVARLVSDLCAEQGHEQVVAEAKSMRTTVLTEAAKAEITARLTASAVTR